jgi:hypothetical protein
MTDTTDGTASTGTAGATSAADTFAMLQKQYFYLDQNFNRLFAATTTDDERDTLRTDYVQARDNYWKARGQRFNDDDPMVQELQQKVGAAQQQIEKAGQRLDDVAGFLDLVTNAVNLGSRLVSLAAV